MWIELHCALTLGGVIEKVSMTINQDLKQENSAMGRNGDHNKCKGPDIGVEAEKEGRATRNREWK